MQSKLMGNFWSSIYICFLLIFGCHCQTSVSLSEPRLISVTPVNSSALTIRWQFADPAYDQSDLIRVSIDISEFYFNYNQTYPSTNFTFTSSNKTITNLTRTFELVNAYYYVCFSSNSTVTSGSYFLAVVNNCRLTRTCLRSNTACPGPSSLAVSATSVTSTSFVVSFYWPNDLPFSPTTFNARLLNNNQSGTPLSVTQNSSYTIRPYQFNGLQARTTYSVNTSVIYSIFSSPATTNVTILTVTTSTSSTIFCSGEVSFLSFFFSVMLVVSANWINLFERRSRCFWWYFTNTTNRMNDWNATWFSIPFGEKNKK